VQNFFFFFFFGPGGGGAPIPFFSGTFSGERGEGEKKKRGGRGHLKPGARDFKNPDLLACFWGDHISLLGEGRGRGWVVFGGQGGNPDRPIGAGGGGPRKPPARPVPAGALGKTEGFFGDFFRLEGDKRFFWGGWWGRGRQTGGGEPRATLEGGKKNLWNQGIGGSEGREGAPAPKGETLVGGGGPHMQNIFYPPPN